MTDTHSEFAERLFNSGGAVFAVAEWLSGRGWDVFVPALKIAKKGDNIEDFFDEGDIFIEKEGKTRKRVEVKGRSIDFTCETDWRYGDPFISSKVVVERGRNDLAAYVVVNARRTHAIIIPAKTKPHWYVKSAWMSNTRKVEDVYACPLKHVIFEQIWR